MNKNFDDILNSVSSLTDIELSEIPAIDLYMDQITSFFDSHYQKYLRNDIETILTKTMINNYVKAKILPPVQKKKYNKVQIVLLIIIYKLKQTLSLDDIKNVLKPMLAMLDEQSKENSNILFYVYDKYLDFVKLNIESFSKTETFIYNVTFENMNIKDAEYCRNLLSILCFSYINYISRRVCEKIIDLNFISCEDK